MMKTAAYVLRWLVVLATPVLLVLTTARVLIAGWYPAFEYAQPSFPRDRYGWTQQQRLALAQVAIRYLNSPQAPDRAISMLANQRLPEQDRPLYTEAELGHMLDVKRVMESLWRVQAVAAVVVVGGLLALLVPRKMRPIGYSTLFAAGLFTTVLLIAMAFFVVTGFDTFFVQFHEVFFPQGNWTFDFSDSLIRLFPEKFWFDAGAIIVGASLLEAVLMLAVGYALSKRARPVAASLEAEASGQ